LSISERTEFDDWLVGFYKRIGQFTMLAVLTKIDERNVVPLCSTYFHVVGDEVDWDEITLMFAGSGHAWDGAAFFPTQRERGGPIDNPTARLRLRELESKVTQDRMTLNEGYFFDALGRKIKLEPISEP